MFTLNSVTDVALPAVLAAAVVAFLLLTLLIAGIIVGVVMLRRMKKRGKRIKNKDKSVEIIECTEKRGELLEESVAKVGEYSIDNDRERRIDDEVALHYERLQCEEEAQYESVDGPQQGSHGRVDSKGIRSEADYYNVVEAAENIPSKKEVGHDARDMGQQDDQPKGTPNVVYAVVDKSKKKRKEKTQGGASATTTQSAYTEEQYYESSSAFGQDWLGNEIGGKPGGNHKQGSRSNDIKGTGPQSEPPKANAVYTVAEKSTKKRQEKTQGGASATTTQDVCTEEQHYI